MTPEPTSPNPPAPPPQHRSVFAAELAAIHHTLEHLKNGRAPNQETRERIAAPAQAAVVAMLDRAGYDFNPESKELTDRWAAPPPEPEPIENIPGLPLEPAITPEEAAAETAAVNEPAQREAPIVPPQVESRE